MGVGLVVGSVMGRRAAGRMAKGIIYLLGFSINLPRYATAAGFDDSDEMDRLSVQEMIICGYERASE